MACVRSVDLREGSYVVVCYIVAGRIGGCVVGLGGGMCMR